MNDETEATALRFIDALYRVHRVVFADARSSIAAVSHLDLGDFMMLRAIVLGTDSPSDLADELGLHAAAISRHVTELVRAGLIVRRSDDADARRTRLVLTVRGEEAVQQIAGRVRPEVARRLGRLDPQTAATLFSALDRLLEPVSVPVVGTPPSHSAASAQGPEKL